MSRDKNILTRLGRLFGQQESEPERVVSTEEWRKKVEGKEENEEKKGENEMMNMDEIRNNASVVDPMEAQDNFMKGSGCEAQEACPAEPVRERYYISIRTGSIRNSQEFQKLVEMDCLAGQDDLENQRTLGVHELSAIGFEIATIASDGRKTSFMANIANDEQFEALFEYYKASNRNPLYINVDNGSLVDRDRMKSQLDAILSELGNTKLLNDITGIVNNTTVRVDKIRVLAEIPVLGQREIPVKNDGFMLRLLCFEKERLNPKYFEEKAEVIDLNDPRD